MDARTDTNGEYEWTKTDEEGRTPVSRTVAFRPAGACVAGRENEEPPGSPKRGSTGGNRIV